MLRIMLVLVLLTLETQTYQGEIGSAQHQVVVLVMMSKGSSVNVSLGFEPAAVTVLLGVNNTITWKNEDTDWHTAHSNIPEFDSGLIHPGGSFTHFFNRAGIYPYHCDPHPWMTGIVIVK
jgi:plastocyanin